MHGHENNKKIYLLIKQRLCGKDNKNVIHPTLRSSFAGQFHCVRNMCCIRPTVLSFRRK